MPSSQAIGAVPMVSRTTDIVLQQDGRRGTKIKFTGIEIERVIEFVKLLNACKDIELNLITVTGYASVLTDEDSDLAPAEIEFKDMPSFNYDGEYRRTVIFKYTQASGDEQKFVFGGRNAIREEWRMIDATFAVSFPKTTVAPRSMNELLEAVFPNIGDNITEDDNARQIKFYWCRRILLGLTDTPNLHSIREQALIKLSTILKRPNLPPEFAARAIQLAEDIGDPNFLADLIRYRRTLSQSAKLCLGRVLRRAFMGRNLNDSNVDTLYYREMVKEMLENVHLSLERNTEPNSTKQLHLKQGTEFLEALSFVEKIDAENARSLLELVKRISEDWGSIYRRESGHHLSLLASAILTLAKLWRRNSESFKGQEVEKARILELILKVAALTDGTLPGNDYPTLRMAAIASAAQMCDNCEGLFDRVAQQAANRIRVKLVNDDEMEEVCVCADSLARLFSLHNARGQTEAKKAYAKLVVVWANTTKRPIRRANARAILEATCQGFPIGQLTSALGARFAPSKSSVRGICHGSRDHFVSDFPTLIVIATAERFDELAHMARELAPEYQNHSEWSVMIQLLQKYAEAEVYFQRKNYSSAITKYQACIHLLNTTSTSSCAKVDSNIVDLLLTGCIGRMAFCQISDNGTNYALQIDPMIDCYKRAKDSAANLCNVGLDSTRYPDTFLAESIKQFLSGLKASGALATAPDRVWKAEMSEPFSRAVAASKICGSINWQHFVDNHLRSLTDLAGRRRDAVDSGVSGEPIELSRVAIEAAKELLNQLIRNLVGARRAERFARLAELPNEWEKFSLRPLGILAYGRGLHW
jgi:hypothetical protein